MKKRKPNWLESTLGKHLEWNDDGIRMNHDGYQICKCHCGDEYPIAKWLKLRETCGKEKCFRV